MKNNGCVCDPHAYALTGIAMSMLDSVITEGAHSQHPWGPDEWGWFIRQLSQRLEECEDREADKAPERLATSDVPKGHLVTL